MRRFTCVLAILCMWVLAVPMAAQEKASSTKAAPTAAAPINLNTATAPQIATLPGIGPKAAQRIVGYRQKNNGFKNFED
jgi:DNA uptake protein ComE-like DNA-binding protein